MSVSLYMDKNVSKLITNGSRIRSVDVLTVQEEDRIGGSAPILLDRATELGRVIFTQDDDFLVEANRRQQESRNFSGVIYAHQQNIPPGDCIRDLETIAQAGDPEDFANRAQYLPL